MTKGKPIFALELKTILDRKKIDNIVYKRFLIKNNLNNSKPKAICIIPKINYTSNIASIIKRIVKSLDLIK